MPSRPETRPSLRLNDATTTTTTTSLEEWGEKEKREPRLNRYVRHRLRIKSRRRRRLTLVKWGRGGDEGGGRDFVSDEKKKRREGESVCFTFQAES